MKKYDIINYYIRTRGYSTYLEIGVDKGICFNAVQCESKESVDPAQSSYSHAKPTYKMTSDELFDTIEESKKWDIILVDGLHHSEQVYKDIQNSLQHLTPGGVIVCHDMNPLSEGAQIVPRQQSHWNGDCWKAWVRTRKEVPYQMRVVDTDQGCGIIDTATTETTLLTLEVPQNLSYKFLNENRKEALNLYSVSEWEKVTYE